MKKMVDSKERHGNLVKKEVLFETALTAPKMTEDESKDVMSYINMRFRERTFDNYEYKEVRDALEEEAYTYELCTENKELLELWDDIEGAIDMHKYA
ncbi:hypothetical protein ECANGB1_325 [Enterospora canceri]|uniref:Uncharacterized protein n=1 Tax=Enterospora canceri TaxID=1081671 RepID=A0A1Y1S574_9MICR|nr:hypothetical protein ECANGB1_325 [Enterospora canceri]